jgi:hypothetical protein
VFEHQAERDEGEAFRRERQLLRSATLNWVTTSTPVARILWRGLADRRTLFATEAARSHLVTALRQ